MLELIIDGRPAVPVRLVPEVAGRAFSPDTLAMILAEDDPVFTEVRLTAYKLHADGSYTAVLPRDWDTVVLDLEDLAEAVQRDKDASNVEWREKACKCLWPGRFVWLDDLNAALKAAFSPDRWSTDEQRDGDYEVDLGAPILPRIAKLASEGFEFLFQAEATAPEQTGDTKAGESGNEAVSENIFRCLKSGLWEFRFAGVSCELEKNLKGYSAIHHLLQKPREPIRAIDLMQLASNGGPSLSATTRGEASEWGTDRLDLGDAGEVLDDQAIREYRTQLQKYQDQIAEAEELGDREVAERLTDERDAILRELRQAIGPSGQKKRNRSHSERARKAVSNNGTNALARLDVCCPELAKHLRDSLNWGGDPVYQPKQSIKWRLF